MKDSIKFEQQLNGFGISLHRAIINQLIGEIEAAISEGRIRSKDERYSVYDFIREILRKKSERETWKRFTEEFPAVVTFCDIWQFPGERQRKTPVTDFAGCLYIGYFANCEFSHNLRASSASHFAGERQSSPQPNQVEQLERSLEATKTALQGYPYTLEKLWRDSGIVNKSQVKGAILRDFVEGRDYIWADDILCMDESTYSILILSFRSLKGADISQLPEIIKLETRKYFHYQLQKRMNRRVAQVDENQLSLFE